MGVGVPFAVSETDLRDERAKRFGQVGRHIGVGILIDRDCAGRMRYDDRGDAIAMRERSEDALHVGSDDQDLLAGGRANREGCLA